MHLSLGFLSQPLPVSAAVVRQGEIVEQGTHADLILRPNGAYATLVRLQASAQHQGLDGEPPLSEEKLQLSTQQPEVLQDLIISEVGHSRACCGLVLPYSTRPCTLYVARFCYRGLFRGPHCL